MSRIYQDDVGVNLLVDTFNTAIPLTATLSLFVEKPGGDTVEWAVTAPMINYTTGVITYTTVIGDLNEIGEYKIQVHGVFTDADEYSNIDTFSVHERIEI
jgi:hypothetical protein